MGSVLGLIAGGGRLPFEIAEGARERGRGVAICAIEGNTDPAMERLATAGYRLVAAGELGRIVAFLKEAGAEEVILGGAFAKREWLSDPGKLRPDARALAVLARVVDRGDDALLRELAAELEREGLPVVATTRYLENRLTPPGLLGEVPVDAAARADLELGMRVAKALGAQDVGQSVVVKDGTVLAVEALEGTDETIRRGASLGGPGAVVVKASKPGQDLRFDLPTVGARTLALGQQVRLRAIGLEAGKTLILDRPRVLAIASAAGIALLGMEARA